MPQTKAIRAKCETCRRKRVKRAASRFCSLSCSNAARAKPKKNKKIPKKLNQKLHDLPVRTQKIIMNVAGGMEQRQAGIDAGVPPKSAASHVSQILSSPKVKATLREILFNYGFTDEFYARSVKDGSEAMKTVSVVSGKNADSETMDFVDVPDWSNRRHYLVMGAKGLGHDAVAEAPIPSLKVVFNLIQPASDGVQAEKMAVASEIPAARVRINVMED